MARRHVTALGLLALLAGAACGDGWLATGVPLAQTQDVIIVAHQDDDLLFMQPDLLETVRAGGGITSVYVTAGNGKKDYDKAEIRYEGLMAAYGDAANANAWTCGWIDVAGHTAEHCRLPERNVSLVFLAYPDGGKRGELATSLRRLYEGDIDRAETIAQRTTVYDRPGLIEAVAQVLRETQPVRVRTLDGPATHGYDHNEPARRLARAARRRARQ
jgi:LmbE family N-acetylglucosaminyl deacetylase